MSQNVAIPLTQKESARLKRHAERLTDYEARAAEEARVISELCATIGERAGIEAAGYSLDAQLRTITPKNIE